MYTGLDQHAVTFREGLAPLGRRADFSRGEGEGECRLLCSLTAM